VGQKAFFLDLDVTDEGAWDRAMEETLQRFGKLNVLVNNAGIAPTGDMEMPFALWRKTLAVNLDGVFLGTRAAIRTISKCGERGSIINVSSTMGMSAEPTTAAYSASKGRRSQLYQGGGCLLRRQEIADPREFHSSRNVPYASGQNLLRRKPAGDGAAIGAPSHWLSRRADRHRLWRRLPGVG
jgi:NAD(P)-dependent dehydrogenase (short-subunit alcohol dehydrogenase family)